MSSQRQGVGLDSAALCSAFPFHFALGPDDRLLQVGPSLSLLCAGLKVGGKTEGCVRVMRPPQPLTYAALCEGAPSFVALELIDRRVMLRGQTLRSGDALLFLGSPWLTESGQLENLGLTLGDFAPHDAAIDYLTLVQTQNVALQDARALAQRLAEARDGLEEERRRAEASNAAKSDFLAMMSHEMRTPLGVIVGLSELLQGPLRPEVRTDFLRRLEVNSRSLLKLIEDTLDLAHLENRELRLEPAPFEPRVIADEVASSLASAALAKGLELEVHVARDVPAKVLGDEYRVRQILLNLVGNAVKFTREGHVSLSVSAQPGPADSTVLRWRVEDSGPGIPPELHAAVFERFVRVERPGEARGMGTGLGLAISAQLVRAMRGSIALQSEPGQGSTFTLTLPHATLEGPPGPDPRLAGYEVAIVTEVGSLACALFGLLVELGAAPVLVRDLVALAALPRRPAAALLDEAAPAELHQALRARMASRCLVLLVSPGSLPQAPCGSAITKPVGRAPLVEALVTLLRTARPPDDAAAEVAPEPVTPSGLILLVEDDPDTREVACHFLTRAGHVVETAPDGVIALEKLRQKRYDLLITDLGLPVLGGEGLIRQVRDGEAAAGAEAMPMLVISADTVAVRCEAAIEAGAQGFLAKPLLGPDLAEAVARLLTRAPPPPPGVGDSRVGGRLLR